MYPPDQIDGLKMLFPELSAAEEGGTTFIRIENLILPEGCVPRTVEALLCPIARDGYSSRLFLSEKISHGGGGTNWNPQGGSVILGRQWWAVSWQTRPGQTLSEMVLDHLGAFRAKKP